MLFKLMLFGVYLTSLYFMFTGPSWFIGGVVFLGIVIEHFTQVIVRQISQKIGE